MNINYKVELSQSLKNKLSKLDSKERDGIQYAFDSNVLRVTEPYTPRDTGTLIASAKTNSKLGKGELIWSTPYARARYYMQSKGSQKGGLRGFRWGERAIAANKSQLETIAKTLIKEGLS